MSCVYHKVAFSNGEMNEQESCGYQIALERTEGGILSPIQTQFFIAADEIHHCYVKSGSGKILFNSVQR